MAEAEQDDQATATTDNTPDEKDAHADYKSEVPETVARALYRRDKHRNSYDTSYKPDEYQAPETYQQYKQYDTDFRNNNKRPYSPTHDADQDYYRSEGHRDYHDDAFDKSRQAVWDQVGDPV